MYCDIKGRGSKVMGHAQSGILAPESWGVGGWWVWVVGVGGGFCTGVQFI